MSSLLILDASSTLCSVALNLNGETLWLTEDQPSRHAQRLLPMVDELMSDAGISRSELDGVAFGCGPGSFTGIRIAVAVAQGVSLALDLPVCGISSLATIAQAALSEDTRSRALTLMDAHMGEVFWGTYELQNGICVPVGDEQVGNPEACLEAIADWDGVIAGDGLQLMPFAGCDLTYSGIRPEARTMSRLAAEAWKDGKFGDADAHPPVYLRNSVAWKKLDEQPSLLKR